jgi:hypothetical protein
MYWLVGFMVFNATFNNIAIIYIVVSFIVGGNQRAGENHQPVVSH